MPHSSRLPVAFTFINDGKEWHGGLNYFRSLFLALQSTPGCRVEPVAFVGARADVSRYGFPDNVRVVRHPVFDRLSPSWAASKLAGKAFGRSWPTNRLIRRHGISVVSHSSPTGQASLKNIAWIPDFQHLHLPEFFQVTELSTRTALYHEWIERSNLVVVSSEHAHRDLQHFAPRFAHKARVLRFCAMRPSIPTALSPDLASTHNVRDAPYFYIPNQTWAHKNHLTAVRALARIADAYPQVKVVCSGSLEDYRSPSHLTTLRREIAHHGLKDRFILLGVIPYAHVAPLMLQSVAVINPSRFEGWSTTVEEAKSLGVPLILSDIEVHHEQCDRSEAAFFSTLNEAALAARMQMMLDHPRPARTSSDDEASRERHARRVATFARDYERIVSELHSSHAH